MGNTAAISFVYSAIYPKACSIQQSERENVLLKIALDALTECKLLGIHVGAEKKAWV